MDTQTPDGAAPGAAPEPGTPPAPEPTGTGPQPSPGGTAWTPPTAPPAPQRPAAGFFAGVRRLAIVRTDDRWIGGVAGGIARRLGVDPLLVRGLLAVSVLLGGLGLVVYGVGWALLPEESDGRIHLEETIAGRFDIALLGAFGLTIVGLGRGTDVFWLFHVPDGLQGLAWVLFVAGLVAVVVVGVSQRKNDGTPRPTSPYGPGSPYGPAGAPAAPGPYGPYGPYAAAGTSASTSTGAPRTTVPAPPAPTTPATSETSSPMSAQPTAAPQPPVPPTTGYGPTPYGPAPVPPAPPAPPAPPYAQAPYGPPPQAYGPYPTGAPVPVATKPPKPPKPPRQGPGATTVGVVVALSLLGLAVLMLADRADAFDGPVLLTAGGIAVVLAGLGIMVSGLRGRTSGVLGFLGIVGLVVLAPAIGVHSGGFTVTSDGARTSGTSQWTPTTRSEAETGLDVSVGDTEVDLTQVPLVGGTVTVPITMDAGSLRIVVPADTGVRAMVSNSAGSIRWDVDGEQQTADGVGLSDRVFETQQARDGDEELVLDVSAAIGDITIEEE